MVDFSRKVTTRDGDEVHIVSMDGPAPNYPIVGYIITKEGEMLVTDWSAEGRYMLSGWIQGFDLVNPDE